MNDNQPSFNPSEVDTDCPQHPERVDTEILLLRIPKIPAVTPTGSVAGAQVKNTLMKRANTENFLTPRSPYDPFARAQQGLPGLQSPTDELVNKYFNSVPTPSTGFKAGCGCTANSALQSLVPPPLPEPKRNGGLIGKSSSHCFQQENPTNVSIPFEESNTNLVAVKPSTAKTHTAVGKKTSDAAVEVQDLPSPLSPLRALPASCFGPTVFSAECTNDNVEPRHPVIKAGRRREDDEYPLDSMDENAQNNNFYLKSAAECFLNKSPPGLAPVVASSEDNFFTSTAKYVFNGSEFLSTNEKDFSKDVQSGKECIEGLAGTDTRKSQDELELSIAWKNTSNYVYRAASSESETCILRCPTKAAAQVHLPIENNENFVPLDEEYGIEDEPIEIRHSSANAPKTAYTSCLPIPQGTPRGYSIGNVLINSMFSPMILPVRNQTTDSLEPQFIRDCATLRVNNLEDCMGYEEIKALFPKCSSITYPLYDRNGPEMLRPTRYCYVLFNDSDDANEAFQKMDGYELRGNHGMALDIEFRQYIS